MSQKKGFMQGWGVLEFTLLAVILLLCIGATGLGFLALVGFELGRERDEGPTDGGVAVATEAAPPTEEPPPPLEGAGEQPESEASITLSPTAGAAGSTVTVSGQGFPADSRVVINLVPKDPPKYALNSAVADANGAFQVDIIVPSDARWLNESPVPVLAEAVDTGVTAQAQLNILSASDQPAVTPVAVGVIVIGKVEPTAIAPPPEGVAQLTATANVNIRAGPGTNYPILGVLLAGQQAEITGRNADATWWQIKFSGSQDGRGWISAAYANAVNIGNVPVVAAPPPPEPPPPTPTPQPGVTYPDWRAEYFSNENLQGPPTLVRNDLAINFDWGLSSPAPEIPADYFSARWTRTLSFPAGTYRFFTRTDDGVRLWVDGLLIDRWQIQSPTTYSADVYLAEGEHNVRMEYFEAELGAVAILSWQRVDTFPDWRAEYYNNPNLSGPPAVVRNEPSINYNWGTGSPAPGIIRSDNFSARWTRQVYFNGGDYTFFARSDDGVRVWVNNDLVIDRWQDGDSGDIQVSRSIPPGNHLLRVEYYERTGVAFIGFSWALGNYNPRPPTAVIRAPSEALIGQAVTFDGTRSQNGDFRVVRWDWDFDDGSGARGDKVTHTYSEPGEYRVWLKVTDDRGYSSRTEQRITIKEDPDATTPPVAVINAPSTGKVNEDIPFDGSQSTSVSPIVRYDWDFGDGILASGPVQAHSYTKPGTYDVSLTVLAENGLRNTQSVNIRVDDAISGAELPTAVINAPTTTEVNQPATFDGSASSPGLNGTLVAYNWNFGDGNAANAITVDHVFGTKGTFVVTLEVINDKGHKDQTTHAVTVVDAPPQPQPEIIGPTEAQVGEQVDFRANVIPPDGITSYDWNFGDNNAGSGQNVSHVYNQAGTYNVVLDVADQNNQSGQATHMITVENVPPPPQPAIDGPGKAFVGESVTFAGRDENNNVIAQWIWDFDTPVAMPMAAGQQSSQVTISYDQPGTYVVTLDLVDDRGRQSAQPAEHTVEVVEKVSEDPVAVISGPSTADVGQTVTFDASDSALSAPAASVVWDFGDGSQPDDTSGAVVQHIYQTAGTYQVTLAIEDINGRASQDVKKVTVEDTAATLPEPTPTPDPGLGNPPVAVFNVDPTQAGVGDVIAFDGGFSYGDNAIVQWEWDFGDGATDEGMGVQHAYNAPGQYAVVLTVTDEQGLSNTSVPQFVEIVGAQTMPEGPDGGPDLPAVEPPPDEVVVEPLPEEPTPEPPPVVQPEEPTPEPPPVVQPEEPTPEPLPANPPVAGFNYNPPNPVAGVPVLFDGGYSQGDAPIVQWLWDFGDGSRPDTNSGMGVPHIYQAPGQYTATLVVVDATGQQSDPSVQLVVVNPAPAPQPQPQPQPQQPVPEPRQPAPEPQQPAPEPQQPAPEPQQPAPEPQPEEPAPDAGGGAAPQDEVPPEDEPSPEDGASQ